MSPRPNTSYCVDSHGYSPTNPPLNRPKTSRSATPFVVNIRALPALTSQSLTSLEAIRSRAYSKACIFEPMHSLSSALQMYDCLMIRKYRVVPGSCCESTKCDVEKLSNLYMVTKIAKKCKNGRPKGM